MALASAPFGLAENSQFFLPMTNGFTALSAVLLSTGMFGSSKNAYRYFFSLSTYCTAAANFVLPEGVNVSSHA